MNKVATNRKLGRTTDIRMSMLRNLTTDLLVYGKVENMIIKGNILSLEENDYNYKLIDNKNRSFPTYYSYGKTHILNYISLKNTPVPYLKEHCNLRFDFFDESKETVEITVKNYQ